MILFKTIDSLHKHLSVFSASGKLIGFVPTMGALHKGHLSLIAESLQRSSITVCSIFVNPTQFNDPADFEKYPVTIEQDILLLEQSGCDILFLPAVNEIYPNGTHQMHQFELGILDKILEGSHRPGHFQGVCQVVHRLLEIVQPNFLFLGRKDLQQCRVIEQLIQQSGWAITLTIVPIMRETTGLAMSSRNTRLSVENRQRASVIYRALYYLQQSVVPGNLSALIKFAEKMIMREGFEHIDYLVIANADTLETLTEWDGQTPVIALVAAFIQGVRLIDNMTLTQSAIQHEK
jgi:pantoate--beta-alanine ligase